MAVSTETLRTVSDMIYHRLGIVADKSNMRLLASKVDLFLLRNNLTEQDLLRRLKDQRFFEDFISVITVNETYFFREKEHISLLPKLIKRERLLKARILSIPCSTGEEPLSIVMELLESMGSTFRFDVVGVDVDKRAIDIARKGIYSRRSVMRVPPALLRKYFEEYNGAYKVKTELKLKVKYYVGNVFDVSFLKSLGIFDFIFCRNLLIYFDTKKRTEALNNLAQIHKSGGYLFISKTETLLGLVVPYKREVMDGVIVYKRV